MKVRVRWIAMVIGTFLLAGIQAHAQVNSEHEYLGKPFSYWLRTLESRDGSQMEQAFDAMVWFGPDARNAVPTLTTIVAEPFAPIQLGADSEQEILLKVENIHRRSGAVDSLAAIGEAAAPSTRTLIEWALKARVLPPETRSAGTDAVYVDLVAIDVLERMRVAGAIAQFGAQAAPAVQEALESGNPEARKLSVAILNSGALPIAADLVKSPTCDGRALGLAMLKDMWPVMGAEHLMALNQMFSCGPKSRVENVRFR
jgi:hypothetical protein